MNPAKLDLCIYKGSTFRKGFQWKIQSTDLAMDLTGCVIKMQIRAYIGAPDVLLDCSTLNSKIVLSDAINGKWYLDIDAADTALLPNNILVYDMDITFPSTDVYTVSRGNVKVIEQVTV